LGLGKGVSCAKMDGPIVTTYTTYDVCFPETMCIYGCRITDNAAHLWGEISEIP